MIRRIIILSGLFALPFVGFTQTNDFTTQLDATYATFKSDAFSHKRIKHHQILAELKRIEQHKSLRIRQVGTSIEGRSLHLISLGEGPIQIFLWSQMHGDEPTATQAIFDMLNFFEGKGFDAEKKKILSAATIHFLPMLNPDGAEKFKRRNALGIDVNRDALMLQSPEAQTLKRVRDSLQADFGFNLHDQSRYYNANRTAKPATISFLAPAYNYEKEINSVRANAMKVIVYMNALLQTIVPGQVGRYNDDFEPRAFGDNIQKWGTSTILIESGGTYNDSEKQTIRRLNYVAILSSIYAIATGEYKAMPLEDYEKIPENDSKLFDLKITNLNYVLHNKSYVLDVGIKRNEIDKEGHNSFYYKSTIADQGDLSTYYGYETFDARDYDIVPAKIDPIIYPAIAELSAKEIWSKLQQGIGYVRVKTASTPMGNRTYIREVPETFTDEPVTIGPGKNPTFFLAKDGKLRFAFINGFLIDLQDPSQVPSLSKQ